MLSNLKIDNFNILCQLCSIKHENKEDIHNRSKLIVINSEIYAYTEMHALFLQVSFSNTLPVKKLYIYI